MRHQRWPLNTLCSQYYVCPTLDHDAKKGKFVDKAKGRISKLVLQENKARQVFHVHGVRIRG